MLGMVFVLSISMVSASESSKWGAGLTSCGKVISEAIVLENGEKHIELHHGQWVLGYLTGVSMADERIGAAIKDLDSDGISLWILNYCRENPTNDLIDASTSLVAFKVKPKKK